MERKVRVERSGEHGQVVGWHLRSLVMSLVRFPRRSSISHFVYVRHRTSTNRYSIHDKQTDKGLLRGSGVHKKGHQALGLAWWYPCGGALITGAGVVLVVKVGNPSNTLSQG